MVNGGFSALVAGFFLCPSNLIYSVSPRTDSTGDDAGTDPAAATSCPAAQDGALFPVPPQAMASFPSSDDS